MAINPVFKEASFDEDSSFDVTDRPSRAGGPSSVSAGWASAETFTAAAGDYPVEFKHTETPQLIKFLDPDGPFAVYNQHFLTGKEGKKSYVCLGDTCPLCKDLGNRPEPKRAFTVVNLSVVPFQRQLLIATPRLFKTLHTLHFNQGPLTKNYWTISRSGVKQTTMYNVAPVKGRDLEEDWGINEAEAEEFISSVETYDRSVIRETSFPELLDIAKALS